MESYHEERKPFGGLPYIFEAHLQTQRGAGVMSKAHYHEMYEMLYCTQGACTVVLSGEEYDFREGDMVLFDPMEVHFIASVAEVTSYVVFKFAREMLGCENQPVNEMRAILQYEHSAAEHRKVFARELLAGSGVPEVILNILRENASAAFGHELAVRSGIIKLFLFVLRDWRKNHEGREERDYTPLMGALEYVDENFGQDVSMDEAARRCMMPYTSFSRMFRRGAGVSFPEYVLRRRLREAERLLATTAMSVTDIAMETGFSSTSYFILRFRRAHGITPTTFRGRFNQS